MNFSKSNPRISYADCFGILDAIKESPGSSTKDLHSKFDHFDRLSLRSRLDWLVQNGMATKTKRRVKGVPQCYWWPSEAEE